MSQTPKQTLQLWLFSLLSMWKVKYCQSHMHLSFLWKIRAIYFRAPFYVEVFVCQNRDLRNTSPSKKHPNLQCNACTEGFASIVKRYGKRHTKINCFLIPYSHTHTNINKRPAMRCSSMEDKTAHDRGVTCDRQTKNQSNKVRSQNRTIVRFCTARELTFHCCCYTLPVKCNSNHET